MATKFSKGETVKVNAVIPQGDVLAIRMDDEGNIFYEFSWVDVNGVSQKRWFAEDDLVAVN
jgi:uncharacterized protein YodC (DUF2158 family)